MNELEIVIIKDVNYEQWHGILQETVFTEGSSQDCLIFYCHDVLKVNMQKSLSNVGVILEIKSSINQLTRNTLKFNFNKKQNFFNPHHLYDFKLHDIQTFF